MTVHHGGLDRQARNPAEVPDAGPKVENARAFQEGITGGHTSRRQVGMPRGDLSPVMQAAENAAKVVEGWSDSKKAYANRVVSPAERGTP